MGTTAVFTGAPAEEATIIGLCFGVLASAFSVGKLTEVSRRVTVPDRNLFVADLQGRLAALGFFAKTELPTYRLFESVSEGTFSLGPVSMNGASLGAGSAQPLDPPRCQQRQFGRR